MDPTLMEEALHPPFFGSGFHSPTATCYSNFLTGFPVSRLGMVQRASQSSPPHSLSTTESSPDSLAWYSMPFEPRPRCESSSTVRISAHENKQTTDRQTNKQTKPKQKTKKEEQDSYPSTPKPQWLTPLGLLTPPHFPDHSQLPGKEL